MESNRAANRIMVGIRLLGPCESDRRHTSVVGSWPSNFPIIGSDIQPGTSSDPQRASGPEKGIIVTRASLSYEDHFSN
jgi:hypothetical protein